MRIRQFICLLVSLYVILFLTGSCGRGHKDFYKVKYPQLSFSLWVPNELNVQEMYVGKNKEGHMYRRIDSTGITNTTKDLAATGKDSNAVNEKRITGNPEYIFVMLGRGGWNLTFNAILSGKYQDTAVVYDRNKMRQKEFLELYVFGPGRDSSFYAGTTITEITKDGRKLYKITDPEDRNITYTGMVGKYWFMLQFMIGAKDTVLMRRIWDQSHFD